MLALTVPPLCLIQARYHSTRLLAKMLCDLGGETLIARGYRIACEAFGREHVVVAIPKADEAGPLGEELRRIGAEVFAWDGPESDVLGRFHACAHRYRWHPDSVIVRYTPDDWRKDVNALRRVASGERLPVEIGGEAFTLAMLDTAWRHCESLRCFPERLAGTDAEHITHALFPTAPPPCPPGVWTIDTAEQLEAARAQIARGADGGC